MYAQIRTVVFDCPDPGLLASFYAALLVMPARLIETAQRVVIGNEQAGVNLGFLQIEDYRPPSWPELAYPQQLHLDIPVYDKRIPAELVLDLGATRLPKMGGGCPVYADPAGHPFCLCDNSMNGGPEMPALPGLVGNIVVDCLAPQRLASFYATLLGIRVRMMDSPGWVVLVRQPGVLPRLAFQGSCGDVPGWRDRRRPQQLHLEIEVDDPSAAGGAMKRFGLRRLDDGESVYADPAGHAFRLVPAARSVRENVSQPTQGSGFGEVAAGLAQREIIGGSNEEARVAFQCPTPQQADALDQVLIDLRARPGVIGVLLCGSMARGTARADSDIDLLVVLGAGTSGFDLHEVGGQVEIEQTRRTVTGWTEQFSPTRPGDESWGYAFLDGVILYDPEGAVARLVATAVEAHAAYRVPPAVRAHYLVLWRTCVRRWKPSLRAETQSRSAGPRP